MHVGLVHDHIFQAICAVRKLCWEREEQASVVRRHPKRHFPIACGVLLLTCLWPARMAEVRPMQDLLMRNVVHSWPFRKVGQE
jgi:hypothetical protein